MHFLPKPRNIIEKISSYSSNFLPLNPEKTKALNRRLPASEKSSVKTIFNTETSSNKPTFYFWSIASEKKIYLPTRKKIFSVERSTINSYALFNEDIPNLMLRPAKVKRTNAHTHTLAEKITRSGTHARRLKWSEEKGKNWWKCIVMWIAKVLL